MLQERMLPNLRGGQEPLMQNWLGHGCKGLRKMSLCHIMSWGAMEPWYTSDSIPIQDLITKELIDIGCSTQI